MSDYGVKGKVIFEMLLAGKSSKEIIDTVGCTKSTISHYRTKIKEGKPLANIVSREDVQKLVDEGLTTIEISEKLNCDRSTISRICRSMNVTTTVPKVKLKFDVSRDELGVMLETQNVYQIAEKYDVTIQTVYNKIRHFEL